jgi:hypothetical protein
MAVAIEVDTEADMVTEAAVMGTAVVMEVATEVMVMVNRCHTS